MLDILKNELQTDPLGLGYAGKDPVAQALLINGKTQEGPVPVHEINSYLSTWGIDVVIEVAIDVLAAEIAQGGLTAEDLVAKATNKARLRAVLRNLDRFETIDITDATKRATLVAACDAIDAILPADHPKKSTVSADVLALGANQRTRAQVLSISVNPGLIQEALA